MNNLIKKGVTVKVTNKNSSAYGKSGVVTDASFDYVTFRANFVNGSDQVVKVKKSSVEIVPEKVIPKTEAKEHKKLFLFVDVNSGAHISSTEELLSYDHDGRASTLPILAYNAKHAVKEAYEQHEEWFEAVNNLHLVTPDGEIKRVNMAPTVED